VAPRPPHRRRPAGSDTDSRVAVALQYSRQTDPSPRVAAKGHGDLAEKIIEIAREHGVTVREDADLAQLLSSVELESQIPVEAFVAVAEILSYIYRHKAV
jgi:flagellar biosynthesis protein